MTIQSKQSKTIYLGDIHGGFQRIAEFCRHYSDYLIIQVGDFGVGFCHKEKQLRILHNLNELLKKSNNNLIAIAGNHDNKTYFNGSIRLSNLFLAPDYTIVETPDNGKIQLIGGGISIDRTDRVEGRDYWVDEKVDFKPSLVQKVDILVTHTAPSRFPNPPSAIVDHYHGIEAMQGENLKYELKVESELVQELSDLSEARHHIFGHLHWSQTYQEKNRTYHLLSIDEFKEIKP